MSNGYVSDRHPAHAAILERPAEVGANMWIVAGIPVWRTYPCACRLGTACNTDGDFPCRCWGRLDADLSISHCCAARAARLSRKDAPT